MYTYETRHYSENELPATPISPDIRVATDVALGSGQEKFVGIADYQDLHSFNLQRNIWWSPAIQKFSHSRSHLTQLAINASVQYLDDDFNTPVLRIKNGSPNDVRIKKDTGVCNTVELRESPLTGSLLEEELFKRIYPIGNEWQPWVENRALVGIEFFVDPTIHYQVKKLEGELVLNGQTNGDHGRSEIDKLLEPVGPNPDPHFWVGELSSLLFLGKGVHGLITGMQNVRGTESIHAPSVLLKGGRTGKNPGESSRVRIEVQGPSPEPGDLVRVQFYRA